MASPKKQSLQDTCKTFQESRINSKENKDSPVLASMQKLGR